MRLKRLELQAFRSFGGREAIDFPEEGLVLLNGSNSATGESSGSGKSSILEAIATAIGYSSLPMTELQCRHSDLPMQVTLTVEDDGREIVLARGAKTYYKVDGKKHTGAKAFSEFVGSLFGVPTPLIRALTYRAQREVGKFITMPDAEKKEFLSLCIPELDEIEAAAEKARKSAAAATNDLEFAKEKLAGLNEELKRLQDTNPENTLKMTDTAAIKEEAEAIRAQLKEMADKLSSLGERRMEFMRGVEHSLGDFLRKKKEELRPQEDLALSAIEAHGKRTADLQKDLSEKRVCVESLETQLSAQAAIFDGQISEAQGRRDKLSAIYAMKEGLEKRVREIEDENSQLKASTCPTCKRQWEKAQALLEQNEAEKNQLSIKLTAMAEAKKRIDLEDSNIAAIKEKRAGLSRAEIEEARARVDQLVERLAEHTSLLPQLRAVLEKNEAEIQAAVKEERTRLELDLSHIDGEIALGQTKHTALQKELASASAKLADAVAKNDQILRQKDLYEKSLAKIQTLVEQQKLTIPALEKLTTMEDSVHGALGRSGYMGSIFDEILEEISHEATGIIAAMPNTGSISLRFTSSYETKAGSSKRSITPVIVKDGIDASLKSLSGGQQTTVELASDLAVATVVSRRTGRMPGWLALDESFDGMGAPTKEICMEVLKRYAEKRLVLVVDHSTETKEIFDQHIVVSMDGKNSTIKAE